MHVLGKIESMVRHHYWQRTGGMLGFAVILGLGGGLAAACFRFSLLFVQEKILHQFAGFPFTPHSGALPHYLFFLVPAVGGLLSGAIVYGFAPEAAGAGTDALIDAFHNRGGYIAFRTSIVKFFASVVTLGTGGCAGQEGPMAQIGGGMGSLLAKIFHLPEKARRILLLTGTAAGLGAIFHAPLGAALTAAEIVYREDFESSGFLPFTVASVVAFACFTVITHQHTAYLHFPAMPFGNVLELFNYALVGLICVPFSWAFINVYRQTQRFFKGLRIKNFCKPAIGGLLVGLLAYLRPEVVGTNWKNLTDAVSGNFTFTTLLLIAGAKILATSLTIGSGGSGGVFGPSLFIGGMAGGAVGFGLHALNPAMVNNPGSYVLVGMGAFFAGAAKAPLAGLIMVCEITGNYGLLPPLLIASTLHLALSRKWSLYESQRHDKFASPVHEHAMKVDVLKQIPLSRIFVPDGSVTVFGPGTTLADAYARISISDQDVYPVLDKDGGVAGLVSSPALHLAVMGSAPENVLLLEDIMTEGYALESGMELREALNVFLQSGAHQLPVLGESGSIMGMLRLHDIMAHYDRITQGVAMRHTTLFDETPGAKKAN
ncbi:MAG: chloride channel protein [Fibrobacteria bacterium]